MEKVEIPSFGGSMNVFDFLYVIIGSSAQS
jgi:hypothetical protein